MATSVLSKSLTIVDHPLVLHKLTLMRDKHTPSAVFRQLLREISLLLAYEVSRDLPMTTQTIETPVAENHACQQPPVASICSPVIESSLL